MRIQVPLDLDRRPLKYQFTSSNRDNHISNFNSRQQHHTIEMKVESNDVSKRSRTVDKHFTLKATDLIDILQNVHIRPQPLTNKIGTHYRSRSSLIQNAFSR